MMARWLPPALLACLVQRALALATAPSVEHLAGHELGHRTSPRHGHSFAAAAVVSDLGQVDVHLRQSPITGYYELIVFGNIVFQTGNAQRFTSDLLVRRAVHEAILHVATWPGTQAALTVSSVRASLSLPLSFQNAVGVDFEVAFGSARDRQTFISNVVADRGHKLVGNISEKVPSPFKGTCVLPDMLTTSLLEARAGELSAVRYYGNVTFTNVTDPVVVARSAEWQEAIAVVISEVAWVFRAQVGILMTVQSARALRVDFWLLSCGKSLCQDVVDRVQLRGEQLLHSAEGLLGIWARNSATILSAYGRLVLHTPTAQLFARDSAVRLAVNGAIRQVAASPGPQDSNLSVQNTSTTLQAVSDSATLVLFQAPFRVVRDRQVFVWDTALDGAEKLASTINTQVPSPFRGNCQLPGSRQQQALHPLLGNVLISVYLQTTSSVSVASDPVWLHAMAITFAEAAGVPVFEVGVLATPFLVGVFSHLWLLSANKTDRQVKLAQVQTAPWTLRRLMFINVEKLCQGTAHPAQVVNGSLALQVSSTVNISSFATNSQVREAMRTALAQRAAVSLSQVQRLQVRAGVWASQPRAVRVDFQVNFGTVAAREAFSRNASMDGGEKLANGLCRQVPAPFTGLCGLPEVGQATTSTTTTTADQLGTILLHVFHPQLFIADLGVQEGVAQMIASAAAVPRPQVSVMMAAQATTIVRVDFWVASTNATLRQAAVQRANTAWKNDRAQNITTFAHNYSSLIFTAIGGSPVCASPLRQFYGCAV